MLKLLTNETETEVETVAPTLDELAREGAGRMLIAALETEVADYVGAHRHERDERRPSAGGAQRQGQGADGDVCGAGTLAVQAPRVNDKRVDEDGQRQKFTSKILPPYMRKSPKIAEVLPILYLRGLSTGDFRERCRCCWATMPPGCRRRRSRG